MLRRRSQLNKNKGFTLVELVVVLVLMGILLALGVSGLLSWQDYSQFKQENTNAETVFYAVQNQFTEYSSSGIFDDKVTKVVKPMVDHRIGDKDSANNLFDGQTISYAKNKYYKWAPDGTEGVALWAHTPDSISGDDDESNYQGSIYYLSADKGDYDRYLDYLAGDSVELADDTKLLFELITTYISDKSVLNGAMWVEFSPEARQVFSVCYSDRVESFTKAETGSDGVISIRKREESIRRDLMMGYYAVDSLSVPIKGRSKGKNFDIWLENDNTLDLVMSLEDFTAATYVVNIYNYSGEMIVTSNSLVSFEIPLNANTPGNIKDAEANPVETQALIDGEQKSIRVPVWKKDVGTGAEIHIVLDAADVQAQSYLYGETYTDGSISADNKTRLLKTFSFYRFGLDMGSIRQIGCGITRQGETDESLSSNVESPTFAYVEKDDLDNPVYGIKNGRHLYNVRFETDYKKVSSERTFRLEDDIDWKAFTGGTEDSNINYFLNSYKQGQNVGIDYDGRDYSINYYVDQIVDSNARNTANYAFPGFKVLSLGDTFTGEKSDGEGCYTISNLTITFAANMAYGVYGREARFEWQSKNADGTAADYALSDFGKYPENPTTGSELHPSHQKVNRGLYPLGLFAENCGNIKNLALNAHKVVGMQLLKTDINGENLELVYTNMVGGFVGNNLGTLTGLKLRNVASLADKDIRAKEAGVSSVNGKTDVGGIFGRATWTVNTTTVTFENLENYAKVSGMENVGGIVGRAFVIRNYLGPNNPTSNSIMLNHFVERESYYDDGYDLYGSYNNVGEYLDSTELCLGGHQVNRLDKIYIKNCKNRGDVSGDELVYHNMIYLYEDLKITQKNGDRLWEPKDNANLSNENYRCAFIGGIAGITMDGYYYDFNAGGTKWIDNDRDTDPDDAGHTKFAKSFYNKRVVVENCSSYRLYDNSELSVLISDGINLDSSSFIYHRLHHDYYVGSLVGYARFTEFKDCGNSVDDEETGDYKAFVFGRSYTGGLFGCFDLSTVKSTNLIEGRYNIVNYTNVIGVMYAGGFAGGAGIGEASQQHLSYKHPSTNPGSACSQITGFADYMKNSGIKNTAVVLGIRREALGYDDNSLLKAQDRAAFEYDGFTSFYSRQTEVFYDSGIGGVIGYARVKIDNCDNIQSEDVKNYVIQLLGKDQDVNFDTFAYSNNIHDYSSLYGGTGVGGIYGITPGNADLNSGSGAYSVVSAVVYGDDIVGGVVGSNRDSNGGSNINNSYLDGTLVLGRNMVGGYIGKSSFHNSVTNAAHASHNFRVYGEYAVGGFAGMMREGTSKYYISGGTIDGEPGVDVEVQGSAYVGGVVGVLSTDNSISGTIKNVHVKANLYAGGIVGAVYRADNDKDYTNPKLDNVNATGTGVSVEADYFAGGMFGLYSYRHNNRGKSFTSYDVIDYSETDNYNNHLDSLCRTINSIIASDPIGFFINIAKLENDVDASLCVNRNNKTLKNSVLKLNATTATQFKPSVKANAMFAGGVFGYIPKGLGITFDMEDREISIPVTAGYAYVNNIAFYDDGVYECFPEMDLSTSDCANNYSYCGGIIGRISKDTTITNALYTGKLTKNNETTYLGQIAEVNAGTISSSVVKGFNSDGSLHDIMGGLVGLNVGTIASNNSIGEGVTLSGKKTLGALMGENRSDMSLGGWNISCGDMNVSEAGGYVGALAGINTAAIDIAGSTVRTGTVTGQASVGAYVGANLAYDDISSVIYNSSVQDFIQNRYDGDYNAYRYNIKDDVADQSNKLYVNIDLTVQNVAGVGLIAGYSEGVISDICISDSCRLSINGSCTDAGSVCGTAVSTDPDAATVGIVRCVNFIDIGRTGSSEITNAGGIVARIFSKDVAELTLSQLDNHGDIYAGKMAGGIFAVSESGDVNVSDCVNTGKVSTASDDGVAGGMAADINLSSDTELRYCRNYGLLNGSAENYGIGPEISAIGNCINAGKLGVDSASGEEVTYGEIGSTEHNAEFVRDFYIDGVSEEPYTGAKLPSVTMAAAPSTIAAGAFNIEFPQEVLEYKNNYNQLYTERYGWALSQGPKNYVNPRLHPEWNHGYTDNLWLYDVYVASGMSDDGVDSDFHDYCAKVFAAFIYTGHEYDETKIEDYLDYLRRVIETGKLPGIDDSGEELGEDTSHWPVQLYVYKYDSDGGDLYSLTFKRWNKYLPAGISGLMYDPITENDRYNVFLDVDPEFMNMVDDTDNYPNTDADSETKNGFVLE